jgi:hypothetical protein
MILGKSKIKTSNGAYKIEAKCDKCLKIYFIKKNNLKENPLLGYICQDCLHETAYLECEYCHKFFDRSLKNHQWRNKNRNCHHAFCSRKCFCKWSHENHKGIVGETIKCANCGKLKYKRPSDLNAAPNAKLRFCSFHCFMQYKKRNSVKIECKHCHKIFVVANCYKNSYRFCSKKCYRQYHVSRVLKCAMCGRKKMVPQWDWNRNLTKTFYCSRECLRKGRLHAKKPTIFEQRIHHFLNSEFPNQWLYTGNGALWINRQNPDFIHIDKKIILEANGCYFHSCPQCFPKVKWPNLSSPLQRAANYDILGYRTIFVWEHDLRGNNWQEIVKQKINDEILRGILPI